LGEDESMVLTKRDFSSIQRFACDITPKRITKKYELEIYIDGKGVSYINGKVYAHSRNKIIFAKPGQERFSIGQFRCYSLHFTCDDPDIAKALQNIPDYCVVNSQIRAELVEYYEKVESDGGIATYAALFQIFELLNRKSSDPAGCGLVPSKEISWIKEYIDEHFTNPIDITVLSKQVYLSPNYLRKKFVEAYGTTIQRYIIDMRLGLVKKLLLTTNKSLSEIAYSSGFNSQSHMNVMFRSAFGVTPLEYKNKI